MASYETTKHLILNNMIVDLDMLGALIEGGIIGEEDISLIITKHCHDPSH